MMVEVMYHNGETELVKSSLIAHLLAIRKIKQFRRRDGWAIVGVHPLRGKQPLYYHGLDRREGSYLH